MHEPTAAEQPTLERLVALARRIQNAPWNRPGSEKAWVLHALQEHQRFRAEVQRAKRVGPS